MASCVLVQILLLLAGNPFHWFQTEAASPSRSQFVALETFLNNNEYVYGNLAITVGDASGELWSYANGNMDHSTALELVSGSKWPSATALLGVLHEHNVSLDAPMSDFLPYWEKDETSWISKITIRHFMSMTSGMVCDSDCDLNFDDCSQRKALGLKGFAAWELCPHSTFYKCVEMLYHVLAPSALYAPGEKFMYGTLTFQFVGAVAEVLTGKPITEILSEYLLKPLEMNDSRYDSGAKVILGANLVSSARDMDKFVHAMLTHRLLPSSVHAEMEEVQVHFSQYSTTTGYWGPYCLGNWQSCLYGQFTSEMPQQCLAAGRHGHPGCNGYWNYIHRGQNYYFNMLPNYTCTRKNSWCGTGSPDAFGKGCPALYGYATQIRMLMAGFLDDIFAPQETHVWS
eukprot:gene14880-17592_t